MNIVVMMGRLTREPDVRKTYDGKAVANYSIAVDRNREEADFFRCAAFGKQAEFAERFLNKGSKVAIIGRLQNHSYEKDGETKRYDEIIVQRQEFAESKKSDREEDGFALAEEIGNLFDGIG